MAYTSSLSDREWEIIEPLLPKKKRTRPPKWSRREILDGILYQLKNGTACFAPIGAVRHGRALYWVDLPTNLPPYSTVFWPYKQWRAEGIIEEIVRGLHDKVREKAEKKENGQP